MNHHFQDFRDDLEELIEEPELMGQSRHKTAEHVHLWARNLCVGLATVLFIMSFFFHEAHGLLRGIAYILGAVAYFSEFAILTDSFTRKVPHKELFMVYCFGPLYILMGLAYLLE